MVQHHLKRRRAQYAVAGLLIAGLAFASGTPSWGSNGKGLSNAKGGRRRGKGKGGPGHEDLGGQDLLDFDSISPKDCAEFLCVASADRATEYIEAGCPGQFATYEPEQDHDQDMESLVGYSSQGASGVSTGTLLSLAGASGIVAVGVGFMAGYKASPSFAYMRIPAAT